MPMNVQFAANDLTVVQDKYSLSFYVFDIAVGDVISKAYATQAQANQALLQLIS